MQQVKRQSGFTLIEMIVSLGIFSFVITISVGALLVLIAGNQRLQGEQSVMTNLAFALDSMTREIRTGYNYYCENAKTYSDGGTKNIFSNNDLDVSVRGKEKKNNNGKNSEKGIVLDCENGRPAGDDGNLHGMSFFEGGDSITGSSNNRILYFYDADAKTIYRRFGTGAGQSIISSELEIIDADFIVTGSSPWGGVVGGNTEQPTVTIYLEAKEKDKDKIYYLQTTVTQRVLDL